MAERLRIRLQTGVDGFNSHPLLMKPKRKVAKASRGAQAAGAAQPRLLKDTFSAAILLLIFVAAAAMVLMYILGVGISPPPGPTPTPAQGCTYYSGCEPGSYCRNGACAQIVPNIVCGSDNDCVLMNRDLGLGCCWAGACQPVDYSLTNWMAVNKSWIEGLKAENCPSREECGPAPMCPIRLINDSFEARCVSGACQKVPLQPSPTPTAPPLQPVVPADITGLSLSTDKEFYHVQEQMAVTVSITAARNIPAVNISLIGVTSSRGYNYVSAQETIPLPQGESQRNYTFMLPYCSPCSGVSYGNHSVAVVLSYGDTALKNATETIEIRQS